MVTSDLESITEACLSVKRDAAAIRSAAGVRSPPAAAKRRRTAAEAEALADVANALRRS